MPDFPIPQDKFKELTGENFAPRIWDLMELSTKIGAKYGTCVRTEIGQPGIPPPKECEEAQIKAIRDGKDGKYCNPHTGPDYARGEIAVFLNNKLGTGYTEDNVFLTSGGMNANAIIFRSFKRGDPKRKKVIHISPFFPEAEDQIWEEGLESDHINIGEYRGSAFYNRLESMLKEGDYLFIHGNLPNNPTGKIFSENDFSSIGKICDKEDITFVHDVAYLGMVYGDEPDYNTIAQHTKNHILTCSFSKIISLAGSRLGAIVIPDNLLDKEYESFKEFYSPSMRKNYPITLGANVSRGILLDITNANWLAMEGVTAFLRRIKEGDESYFENQREIYGKRLNDAKEIIRSLDVVEEMDYGIENQPSATLYTTMGPKKELKMNSDQFSINLARYGILAPSMDIFGEYKMPGVRICISKLDGPAMDLFQERINLFNRHYS